jgi:hypothetical protein
MFRKKCAILRIEQFLQLRGPALAGPTHIKHKRSSSGKESGCKAVADLAQSDEFSRPGANSGNDTAEFKEALGSARRALIEDGIARMTLNTARAAARLVDMAEGTQSKAPQFAAARAILLARIDIVDCVDLEPQIRELEKRFKAHRLASSGPAYGRTGGYWASGIRGGWWHGHLARGAFRHGLEARAT